MSERRLEDLETERNGKIIKRTKIWLPRGLVIPGYDGGQVVSLRIRRPEADRVNNLPDTKDYVVPGSSPRPLVVQPSGGLPALAYAVVESELDAMMLATEAGAARLPVGAVAVLSASGKPCPKSHHLLKNASVILVCLDFDAVGAKAAQWWPKTYPQARRWPVPVR